MSSSRLSTSTVLASDFWPVPGVNVCAPRDGVHVWAGHLQSSSLLPDRFLRILSTEERDRAARFCFERDRRRHVFTRGLARVVLGRYLQEAPEDVQFQYSSFGKPVLSRGTLHFNISHSGELVLLAVSSGEVGVDVELLRPVNDFEGLAKRYFSTREYEGLSQLNSDQKQRAFFVCWTRKEAFIKALGTGLTLPLNEFDVTVLPDVPPKLAIHSRKNDASRWRFHELPSITGFAAALVTAAAVRHLQCWQFAG